MARMTEEEVLSWAASNVTNEESLKTLSIINALCTPELIEYLAIKCPNVADITVKGQLWHPTSDMEIAHGDLKRILGAVKGIREKKLKLIIPPTITTQNVIPVLNDSDSIAFTFKEIDDQTQLKMKIKSYPESPNESCQQHPIQVIYNASIFVIE